MKEHLKSLVAAQSDPLARRNALREYLQARILQTLQETGSFAVWAFLGGTALRFLYGMPRFSEDLDFSIIPGKEEVDFRSVLSKTNRAFEAENYAVSIKVNDRKTVKSAFIRFPGLLHEMGLSPRRAETIAVKVEVDSRPPAGARTETSLVRRHVTLHLSHYDKSSLLAGKLHAILSRPWLKGRDLFDLTWYLADQAWPEPNIELLNNALAQTNWNGPPLTDASWRGIVLNRLERIEWKNALDDVRPFLEREQDLDLLTMENCERLLRT